MGALFPLSLRKKLRFARVLVNALRRVYAVHEYSYEDELGVREPTGMVTRGAT